MECGGRECVRVLALSFLLFFFLFSLHEGGGYGMITVDSMIPVPYLGNTKIKALKKMKKSTILFLLLQGL
ncbi:hypothetical protein L873DRAFT_1806230 [Choiromyces venosus 120613-1]|uniref:Uncharacterized protein n=1 Tax=Choiromyces venosus 120613-1 TaxID=1336337 RepID=A0A3N4JSD3_9PEZI|nr:hypothetical protein L873DRAFT_1806230 [Choiromyces venosus 120613-1]